MLTTALNRRPRAVLFDRDGTLVVDVPYNRDPELVQPMPGVRAALARMRRAGIRLGVVSNQSGVGRGRISPAELDAVTAKIERELGPFDVMLACPHRPEEQCRCRKPAPGMILDACKQLALSPTDVVVVGDIAADVEAALAAGAQAIMVPTPATLAEEISRAPRIARSLDEVASLILSGTAAPATAGLP